MKQKTERLIAVDQDKDVIVEVSIKVRSHNGLTQKEVGAAARDLATSVVRALPSILYINMDELSVRRR